MSVIEQEIKEIFSERLEGLKRSQGMGGQDLAVKIGVTRQLISWWIAGKNLPKYHNLVRIADLFGVSVDYLLGRTDVKELSNPKRETVLSRALNDPNLSEIVEEISEWPRDRKSDAIAMLRALRDRYEEV